MQRTRIGRDGAERLGSIELLGGLSLGQRRMLAELVDEIAAVPGEVLMRQGEPGYEVLMLEQGSAEVLQDGRRINVMGPGDFFGELAVLEDGVARTASVVAASPLRALVFTAHFMREMRARLPQIGEQVDRAAADRRERDRARS